MSDGQERTESASQRRRDEAVRRGQVAHSADLSNSLLLLAGLGALWALGDQIGAGLAEAVRGEWSAIAHASDWSEAETTRAGWRFASRLAAAAGGVAGVTAFVAVLGHFLLSGFHLSPEALRIDWARLDFSRGWTRLFSRRSAIRALSAMFKVALIVPAVWRVFRGRQLELLLLGQYSLDVSVRLGWRLLLDAGFTVAMVLLVIGLVDYLYQRWQHEQDLKMTRQEARLEHRDDEGDPEVKARIRKLQRERAANQMVRSVADASAVVRNPTHFAVALKYERGSRSAPKVVAKGADLLALRIIQVAEQNGVPVLERPPLARALYHTVEVGQEIPVALYQAVIEILLYIQRVGGRRVV